MNNIEIEKKAFENVNALKNVGDSNKVLEQSFQMLKPNKKKMKRLIIFLIIEILIAYLITIRNDAVGIASQVMGVFITVLLALLAIVFTGYALFQALLNDQLLLCMVATGNKNNNKLSEINAYFVKVMSLQWGTVVLDLCADLFMRVLPETWVFTPYPVLNFILSLFGLTSILYINIECLMEMKSFIFNVFQLFSLYAYDHVLEITQNVAERDQK